MKRILIVLIYLHIVQVSSFSQILQRTTDNKKLRVVMPPKYPSLFATTGIRSVVFLEYGDGNFTNNPSTLPYGYKIPGNYRSLMQSVVLYDTIKRPPMRAAGTLSFPPSGPSGDPSVNLLGSKRVLITPSTSDIVPDEGMVFALTYRLPTGVAGNVEVNYDVNKSNAFLPIRSVSETTSYDGADIEVIRPHHAEVPTPDAGAKKLSFKLPAGDSTMKNIFFNLKTNLIDFIDGKIPKEVITVTLTAPGISETYSVEFAIRFSDGHDPNYLLSTPECLEYPAADHKLFYTLHFENTGSGPVKNTIRVEVQLPDGIRYDKILINDIRLGESYHVGSDIEVKAIPAVTRKNGLIILHRIANKKLILLIKEDPTIPSTSTKHILAGNYPGRIISYEKKFGEIKFRTITTTLANRFLVGWASVSFDTLNPEVTKPSITYISKKCPSDCFYYK